VLQHFVLIAKYLGLGGTVFDTPIKSWFFVNLPVKEIYKFTTVQILLKSNKTPTQRLHCSWTYIVFCVKTFTISFIRISV
jgi:hypothetical protein